ncbi:MAG: ferredoxin family protein [Candidatus Omnitrophota bacterium]
MILVKINKEFCKGCKLCISVCPKHSIKLSKALNKKGVYAVEFIEDGTCTGCAQCAMMCPEAAIEVERDDERK